MKAVKSAWRIALVALAFSSISCVKFGAILSKPDGEAPTVSLSFDSTHAYCNQDSVAEKINWRGSCGFSNGSASVSLLVNDKDSGITAPCVDKTFSIAVSAASLPHGNLNIKARINDGEQVAESDAINCSVLSVVDAFQNFSYAGVDGSGNDLTRLSVFGSLGAIRSDYGPYMGPGDADPADRGLFSIAADSKSIKFARTSASTVGEFADHSFLPDGNDLILSHRLSDVYKITIEIKSTIDADSIASDTGAMCGLTLGFGSSSGGITHATLPSPKAARNLNLNGRWASSANIDKQPRDFIRFIYATYNGALKGQEFSIDAPINSFNQTKNWEGFGAASWNEVASSFAVMKNLKVTTAGDWIKYRMEIIFPSSGSVAKVILTPLDSNVDMTGWQKQTLEWDMAASAAMLGADGLPKGGLDLTKAGPALSDITLADFREYSFNIGFVGNLAPRECVFSNLVVLKKISDPRTNIRFA